MRDGAIKRHNDAKKLQGIQCFNQGLLVLHAFNRKFCLNVQKRA
jgi:hypothetical protein